MGGDPEQERGHNPAGLARRVVRGVFAAWELGDIDRYLELIHPDARLMSVRAGDRVLTRDDLGAALEAARDEDYFLVSPAEMRVLDDVAVIVPGTLRMRTQYGGHALSQYVWLFAVKDGLVFRIRPFDRREDAEASYAREGVTLGI